MKEHRSGTRTFVAMTTGNEGTIIHYPANQEFISDIPVLPQMSLCLPFRTTAEATSCFWRKELLLAIVTSCTTKFPEKYKHGTNATQSEVLQWAGKLGQVLPLLLTAAHWSTPSMPKRRSFSWSAPARDSKVGYQSVTWNMLQRGFDI